MSFFGDVVGGLVGAGKGAMAGTGGGPWGMAAGAALGGAGAALSEINANEAERESNSADALRNKMQYLESIGLSPLAAAGAAGDSSSSVQPVFQDDMESMGQNLSRARAVNMTSSDRAMLADKVRLLHAQADEAEQNAIQAKWVATHHLVSPPRPGSGSKEDPFLDSVWFRDANSGRVYQGPSMEREMSGRGTLLGNLRYYVGHEGWPGLMGRMGRLLGRREAVMSRGGDY